MKNIFRTLVLFAVLAIFPINAWAGKFYFTMGYNFDKSSFDSAEISLSSGGNYASTVDLGGTYYFNDDDFRLLSFDVFSSLDSVQEYNFLFAAGVRVFALGATPYPLNSDPQKSDPKESDVSYGLMPGLDLGYRFETPIPTVLLWTLDYSPNLLTGGKLTELIQTGILYEIMFTPIVIGHVSYRYGTTDYDLGEDKAPDHVRNFENTLGLGIKIRF